MHVVTSPRPAAPSQYGLQTPKTRRAATATLGSTAAGNYLELIVTQHLQISRFSTFRHAIVVLQELQKPWALTKEFLVTVLY